MMKRWTRAIKVLLIISLVFVFTGCSQSADKKDTNKAVSNQIENSNSKETQTADEKIELTMFYPVAVGGPVTKLIDKIVSDFEAKNPNITINPVFCGSYSETMTKTQTAINGNKSPDLGVLFSIDLFTLMDMDAIEPLDDYIAANGGDDLIKDFYPAFMENGQANGKTWGLPFQRSTIVMYYNKDAFKEAGLNPDMPPKTWEELEEYSKALVKKDSSGNVTRWGIEIPSTDYQYWMHQALTIESGMNMMNGDGTEVYYNSDEAKEAVNFWLNLSKKNNAMPEGIIEWKTVPTDFIEGKTAIMYHTTGNLTNVKDQADFDFGVAMLPENKSYGSPTGGGNLYIFKNIPESHKQAAWEFIEYATSPEVLAQWSIDTGYVAPRASAYETDILKQYTKEFPYALVAKEQLKYAKAELSTHSNGEVQKIVNDCIQEAITQTKSVDEALDEAQEKITEILKIYH